MNKNISGLISTDSRAPIRFFLGALLFLGAIVFMAKIFSIVLQIPGIPYNVRELFLDHGSFFRCSIFSSAILWVGLSAALITDRVTKSRISYISLPFLIGASGIVSYWLLNCSVTDESISDIVGSSNIWWFVFNKHIWGDWGVALFKAIGSSDLISIVERYVRYLALYCPIVFFMVICSIALEKSDLREWMWKFFYFVLISLPWLILSKMIAFDYSSTDNLNELIAVNVAGGWGGGVYLYLLVILILFNSVYISKNIGGPAYKYILMVALTLLAVPTGWYFIKTGLVSNFKKYDVAYSGVDFLLGPDRKSKLPDLILFFRWSLLYMGAVFVLFYGHAVVSVGKIIRMEKTTRPVDSVGQDTSRPVFMTIWLIICFLIIYGSFFPFHFQFDVDQSVKLFKDLMAFGDKSGFSDIVQNIVLYLPFGFAGAGTMGSRRNGFWIVLIIGGLFSFVLQVLQIFTLDRVPSLIDVFSNVIGCLLGIVSTYWIKINAFSSKREGQFNYFSVPVVIAACWLFSQLIPFVPSLDLGELKNSLKPLFIYHEFSWVSFLSYLVCWLVFGSFVFSVYRTRRSKLYFGLVIVIVLCLQVIIITRFISISNLLGGSLAMIIWILFFDSRDQKNQVLLILISGLIFINGLLPLKITGDLNPFQFIPFHGFLSGNMLYNSIKLFEKLFIYGSLVVLLRTIFKNRIVSIFVGCFGVLLIELLQIFTMDHSPEITDPLLVLIIAILIGRIERSKSCTANLSNI